MILFLQKAEILESRLLYINSTVKYQISTYEIVKVFENKMLIYKLLSGKLYNSSVLCLVSYVYRLLSKSLTHLKPTLLVGELISPLPRLPALYLSQ
ncbi:Uncharacterised protein [Sphingobacterium daejeonense]|nr:Uncharacterised protein [Sphingobacterium daejeonense]